MAYVSLPRIAYACILYPITLFLRIIPVFDRARRPPSAVLNHDGSPRGGRTMESETHSRKRTGKEFLLQPNLMRQQKASHWQASHVSGFSSRLFGVGRGRACTGMRMRDCLLASLPHLCLALLLPLPLPLPLPHFWLILRKRTLLGKFVLESLVIFAIIINQVVLSDPFEIPSLRRC